jgi:hypothetical protein
MLAVHRRTVWLALVASLNLSIPWQAIRAAEHEVFACSATQSPELHAAAVEAIDVALAEGGVLAGRVYDTAGRPLANIEVTLIQNGEVAASTISDASGVFRFGGVAGGTCQIATAHHLQLLRTWAPHTAPPSAQQVAMIVHDETVVRGQYGPPGCGDSVPCGPPHAGQAYGGRPVLHWMRTHPGMVMAGVAAAIAIPVAIAASDDDDHS